jgi:hypothetical protein
MAWGIGGFGKVSGGLKSAALPKSVSPLSKLTRNVPKPKIGTLSSAFAVKAKKIQLHNMPTDAAIVAKEKRRIVINRPSVISTFSNPLSNPRIGMSRIPKVHESPMVKHERKYKPLPKATKVQPYRPAWGAFRWGG